MADGCTPACENLGRKKRVDGRSASLMRTFLECLSATGNISDAARVCGRSLSGVYALRYREPAFGIAWNAARRLAREVLFDTLLERAFEGETHISVKNGDEWRRTRRNYRLGLGMIDKIDTMPVPREVWLFTRYFDDVLRLIGNDAGPVEWRDWLATVPHFLEELKLRDLFPLPEESAENRFPEFSVWSEEDGLWRTDFPPPQGFDGEEDGEFGEEDYARSLTDREVMAYAERLVAEREKARDPDLLARGTAPGSRNSAPNFRLPTRKKPRSNTNHWTARLARQAQSHALRLPCRRSG